jgi:adenine-specific DNA-methyltransferase
MDKITADDPTTRSANLIDENIHRLKEIYPEVFTEGKIDFDALRQLLGDKIEEREEKFGLNWSGKRMAKQVALTPSNKTLRPCKEESLEWETTGNLYIEGDNLEVLKLLQKSYADSVKMIYIDPPYNTGNDFIYSDKFSMMDQEAMKSEGFIDDDGARERTTDVFDVNTKNSSRYHTNWLNMMYPRLRLARNLLSTDGVLFISIDDKKPIGTGNKLTRGKPY